MTDKYVMGHSAAEAERLQLQAAVLAPHSAHLFRLAGIGPGMRVLDVGCGAGDVSMLIAELVGPTGAVIGVDPAVLEHARARTARVDALVGRLILLHLKQPAATVRSLSRYVRSGGVVSLHDYNCTRCRAVPPTPTITAAGGWLVGTLRAAGINPDTGDQIASILRDAGLAVEGAASASAGGPADSLLPEYLASTIRDGLPALLRLGIATEAEVDIDTFGERVVRAMKDAGSILWAQEMAAAWARVL